MCIRDSYVGLVSSVCFARFGCDVTLVDIDEQRIAGLEAGRLPIFEPGLEQAMAAVRAQQLVVAETGSVDDPRVFKRHGMEAV